MVLTGAREQAANVRPDPRRRAARPGRAAADRRLPGVAPRTLPSDLGLRSAAPEGARLRDDHGLLDAAVGLLGGRRCRARGRAGRPSRVSFSSASPRRPRGRCETRRYPAPVRVPPAHPLVARRPKWFDGRGNRRAHAQVRDCSDGRDGGSCVHVARQGKLWREGKL